MSNDENFPTTYDGLLQLVQRLRGPAGCPWDQEQTRDSLKGLFLAESYELIEAIEQDAPQKLVEELGDVLFHVVFQIQIGNETDEFDSEQVLQTLVEKLTRRHPHVFGEVEVTDAREVEANWEVIKREEKTGTDASILEGVPRQMPALAYAHAIQVRAARTGFDWEDFRGVVEKVAEEVEELDKTQSATARMKELGDLLFSMVNAARWLDVDSEEALRQANARFCRRFATMEKLSRERGLSLADLSLDEKEAVWEEAKRLGD